MYVAVCVSERVWQELDDTMEAIMSIVKGRPMMGSGVKKYFIGSFFFKKMVLHWVFVDRSADLRHGKHASLDNIQ